MRGNPSDPRWFPFPPALPLVALLLAWLLGWIWPVRLHWPLWLRILGWVLFIVPHAFSSWAAATFVRRRTALNPIGETSAFVVEGPFRYSRNPMYLTLLVLYLGGVLAFHLLWGFLLILPLFFILRSIVLSEERYMDHRFGQPYRDYCRRVRRWVGGRK